MLNKQYISDKILTENAIIQSKWGKQMKAAAKHTQRLEEFIEGLGHTVIEMRKDYLNSTIIIKTKENINAIDKDKIKERIAKYIRVRVIFYSEGDLV